MYKNTIAIFFSILFVALITAPTIIIAIDHTADISYFSSITEEEEENKGNQNLKEINVLNSGSQLDLLSLFALKGETNLEYAFKTYPKPHLNLISPPPEFIS